MEFPNNLNTRKYKYYSYIFINKYIYNANSYIILIIR